MTKTILRFGLLTFALLALFQLSKYTLFAPSFPDELWVAIFAVLFIALGVVLSRHISQNRPAEPVVHGIDLARIVELGITKREHEVLRHVARGLSNREIADALFVSESTVKTHVSSLLSKLGAKRRTQAVTRAKEMNIVE